VGVGWYDKDKKPIPIRQGTEMNYVYLLGGHKEENWRQFKGTFAPAAKAAEGQPAFTEAEIPPTAAFFDIRLFMLEYPKPGFFDDVSASQPEAVKP